MTTTTDKANTDIEEVLNRVAAGGERIVVVRNGKDIAAVIPVEDLALLEELEDRLDVDAARKALAESDERIPYEQVREELGLT